jgi:hypothetical protein
VAGCCECGDEPSGSIKCDIFFSVAEDLLASQEGLLHAVCGLLHVRPGVALQNSRFGPQRVFVVGVYIRAGPGGRAVYGIDLKPLDC